MLPPCRPRPIARDLSESCFKETGAHRQIYRRAQKALGCTAQATGAAMADLLLGQVLRFAGDPFATGRTPPGTISARRRAGRGGPDRRRRRRPTACAPRHPQARVTDYGRALISAGFIDAHVHYPQTAIIASWGKRLIDWLNTYTFPEEMRFADPRLCRRDREPLP